MSALPLVITSAGLAALINAQNTGASAVVIDSMGFSATQVAVTAATTSIPGEIKRIDAVAGQVVADDTIHVSVYDQTADTYAVRTLALYLDDGTLFAAYSQAAVIVEKAGASMVLLDADIRLSSAVAANIEFSGGGWINPPASETVVGVLRLATTAEATAGTNHSRAVTPLGLKTALDARLGAGAPSAFVKTLLTAASAAALRTLLAIKGAALKDEGAGNGLDADKLDGQEGAYYRAWANLTGVPATFAPTAHTHAAGDVTSGVFDVARIPALAMSAITGLVDALAGKAAAAHTHAAGDVTSGTFDVARIPALAMEKITGLVAALALKADLAGATFTGLVRVKGSAARGSVELNSSSSAYRPGLVTFHTPDGTRRGYVGYAASDEGGELLIQGESGWGWRFSGRPSFGGNTPWDSSNLANPAKTDAANTFTVAQKITTPTAPDVLTLERTVSGDGANLIVFANQTGTNRLGVQPGGDLEWQSRAGTWSKVWHAGNFTPALKADLTGALFTGTVGLDADAGTNMGGGLFQVGPAGRSGLVSFRTPAGVRAGWIGSADDTIIYMGADGARAWSITGTGVTLNPGSVGVSITGSGGLSVVGSGGLTVSGSGGVTTTKFTASAASVIENGGNYSGGSWAGAVLLTLSNFHPTLAFKDQSTGALNGAIAYDNGAFTFRYDAAGDGSYSQEAAILSLTQPTPPAGNNSARLATTAFVQQEIAAKAPLASPALTGTPTAPTAAAGTNTTRLATTAFVQQEIAAKAPLASPALTGTPTAPTAAAGTNTTQLATTAFVTAAASPATAAQYRANTGAQPVAPSTAWGAAEIVTLAQAATIAVNLANGLNFTTTMTGNRTLGAPSNAKPGQSGVIQIVQDATGGRTLGFSAAWKFQNGTVPILSAAAGARDVLVFTVIASGDVVASLMKDVR